MLFLAHINDKDDTQAETHYHENGTATLSRIFCTAAVMQYQVQPIERCRVQTVDAEGNKVEKPVYTMDEATRVQGQGTFYFVLPLNIKILDALTVGYQIGAIAKSTIVDLREDNWDQIKSDYEHKKGHFNYMRKVIK